MHEIGNLFCYLVCISLVCASSLERSQCSPTTFTFSLINIRNRTGQWTTQVQLTSGSDQSCKPWNVVLDHETAHCNGQESFGTTATVSGDCKTGEFEIMISSFCNPTVNPGPGYELVNGLGYYKLYSEGKTWHEARNICQRDGAHLLILNSGAEMDAIRNIWNKAPKFTNTDWQNYMHVGAHGLFKKGEYITILDQPLIDSGYWIWDINEPNGAGGNEDCLSVKNTGGLNDVRCELPLAFTCEREL